MLRSPEEFTQESLVVYIGRGSDIFYNCDDKRCKFDLGTTISKGAFVTDVTSMNRKTEDIRPIFYKEISPAILELDVVTSKKYGTELPYVVNKAQLETIFINSVDVVIVYKEEIN